MLQISNSKIISHLLRNSTRVDGLHTMQDWSYRCQKLTGPGWIIVGDAAGFVDPILSTGMSMALQGAFVGAKALNVSIEGGDTLSAMSSYETFYYKYMGQFFDFVHYFYDANRHLDSYFWQARRLVNPSKNLTARNAFIHLISGLENAATSFNGKRSFEMAVFDNLGSPLKLSS